ncbi:acetyl-CoA hydrolase/transferase family protein [Nocardia sp. NBC_00416]|uniref:acetyl-CoA hydrolase/transferase family protein n=1 Tax=Nocardia sp. NBC_00416 TaxID=2975991 RepID=UPI002E2380A3
MTGEEIRAADIDFTRYVRPGDTVAWTQGAGEPIALIERLLGQRHEIGPFRILIGASYSGVVRPEHADVCTFIGFGAVGSTRSLVQSADLDVIPVHLSDVPVFLSDGTIPVDVLLLQVSEGAAGEPLSLGAVNGYVHEALGRARVAIAEVNANAPWTHAREHIDRSVFDVVTHSDRALVESRSAEPSALDMAIAENIVSLIPNGSVLQLGIGAVPTAVAACLRSHQRLGIHSGVIGDPVVDLIETGAVDNSTKTIDRGITVTGGLVGTAPLYRFAHRNPSIRVDAVTYTHAQSTLAGLDGFIAINSAIEVDLTGQVGSEVAGTRYVGTIGGQVDFVRGALASKGGRSVIGLPSRTLGKGYSRIVPLVESGVVTVGRADADVVVTEFGVAHLRGRGIRGRIEQMISIAHPDDRERLAMSVRSAV